MTEIRDAGGNLIAAYFNPDVSSDKFIIGFSYNIGNKGPDGTSNPSTFNPVFVGIGGQTIYFISPSSLGGGSQNPGGGTTIYSPASAPGIGK